MIALYLVSFWSVSLVLSVSITYDLHDQVDAATDYVIIPNRGLKFTRAGTIFSHPQMNLMTAVITLDPLKFEPTHQNTICREALWNVERRFNKTMEKYKAITHAIFQAKNIFTTEEVCEIFTSNKTQNTPEICPQAETRSTRQKRVVGLGAYAAAGAAMAVAIASAGLAANNAVEIHKVNEYLKSHEEEVAALQQKFKNHQDKLDVVLDTQRTMLGYMERMTVRVDDLNQKIDCMHKHFQYLHWAGELQAEVENLLQFVFAGNTYGRLTPTLIRPDLLKQFIDEQSEINSKILGQYPNMLYQSAMASILNADFENLQFTFLITYPNFGNDPIYPYLTLTQNGFWAKVPGSMSNELKCFMFDMPHTAIIHDNKLHALTNKLTCPTFGNVKICSKSLFNLIPMSDCLDLNNYFRSNSSQKRQSHCPLVPCVGSLTKDDSYISSPPGLLVRTLSPTIDIVYDKPRHQLDLYVAAMLKTITTPESGAIFITWHRNVSAVSFSKTVVYSPTNANHHVSLTISADDQIATLDPDSLFYIPDLGTKRISEIMNTQEQRLQELENRIEPSFSAVKSWATDTFSTPLWLKVLSYATFAIGALTIIKFCYTRVKNLANGKSCFSKQSRHVYAELNRPQSQPVITMTPNVLYPILDMPQNPQPNTPHNETTSRETTTMDATTAPATVLNTPAPPVPGNQE